METCPSPEMGDSRKRPLDTDTENETTKRSHFSSGKSDIDFGIIFLLVFLIIFRFILFFLRCFYLFYDFWLFIAIPSKSPHLMKYSLHSLWLFSVYIICQALIGFRFTNFFPFTRCAIQGLRANIDCHTREHIVHSYILFAL